VLPLIGVLWYVISYSAEIADRRAYDAMAMHAQRAARPPSPAVLHLPIR
jgi:hypothetical protein